MFIEPRNLAPVELNEIGPSRSLARRHVSVQRLLPNVLHAWRDARDRRGEVQQAVYRPLEPHGCGLLAPVFDGLLTACEACLRRRLAPGRDDGWIARLFESDTNTAYDDTGAAHVLHCAVCSAQIMLFLEADGSASAPTTIL